MSSPFPASEAILSRFVALLYKEKLRAATVKNYLAAVRHSQIALGLGDPDMGNMPQLEYVVKGVKRSASYSTNRTRLPITPDILRGLKSVWKKRKNQRDASMLWAAVMMCFCVFLRSGEVVVPSQHGFDPSCHLGYGDVLVDNIRAPSFIEVRIKASKTDPFRKGVSVFLGRVNKELCPVASILDYIVRRGSSAGPFFMFADGTFLTRDRFVQSVRAALDMLGIDSSAYAGHSFRIGAATTAAQRGVQDALIKTLGRWESAAYTVYIRTSRETLCSVTNTLVGTGSP